MSWLSILAIGIALVSLFVGFYERLWLGVWKPFRLSCDIRGIVWHPPLRPGTPFSIVVPLALTNLGARHGLVRAAFVQLQHTLHGTQYRLEARALIHPAKVLESLQESGEALESVGAFITFGKYESKDIGLWFMFPPEDAARFRYFDDPDLVPFGPYELQLWWLTQRGWTSNGRTLTDLSRDVHELFQHGERSVSLSGELLDAAPGAPGSPTKADSFAHDIGDSVQVISDRSLATIVARFRRMPDIKLDQKPDNHYGIQMVDAGEIRDVLEREVAALKVSEVETNT